MFTKCVYSNSIALQKCFWNVIIFGGGKSIATQFSNNSQSKAFILTQLWKRPDHSFIYIIIYPLILFVIWKYVWHLPELLLHCSVSNNDCIPINGIIIILWDNNIICIDILCQWCIVVWQCLECFGQCLTTTAWDPETKTQVLIVHEQFHEMK